MSGGEKRRSRRQDVRWTGLIHDDHGSMIATCIMEDVSASGAKLIIEAGMNIPDHFVLALARNAGVRRPRHASNRPMPLSSSRNASSCQG